MKQKLTVFYVVKNEQDRIAKSLESIKDIADEIIVVDTGSIDRTVDICKAFKAKIFKYRWNDSFSDVRNFALSKCLNKFVMYLDADEILNDASTILLGKILLTIKKYSAYYVKITNKNDEFEVGKNLKSPQIRLFYNCSTIKFKGIANESVEDYVYRSSKFSILSSDLEIDHYPLVGRTKNEIKKKELYYKKIQSKEIKKDDLNVMNGISKKSDVEQKKCAIIISVYNLLHLTKKCVDSVLENTSYPFKLFIINDDSNTNTSSYINSIEGARVINMENNFGVSKCRNRAMRLAIVDKEIGYICFLDNDTEVSSEWLKNLIGSLEKSNCGMIGPITNSATGDQRMVKNNWVSKFSNDKIIKMVVGDKKERLKSTKFLNRFCQVFRSSIIGEVGFLDESFGKIGWEDNDFCRRFIECGLDLMIDKGVYVYHQGHSTSALNNVNYFKYIQKNARLFYKKWNISISSDLEDKKLDSIQIRCDSSIKNPRTSIIVLTYNNLNINKKFFNALQTHTSNYELIVVDNGSTDGTIEYLKKMKNIILIKNKSNLGVIVARNQGLRMATADYLICLDNDQIVKKDWLFDLHEKMKEGFDFVGVEAWEVNSLYSPIKRHTIYKKTLKIDYVGAGGCLMKRSVLNKIGIYDERFGMAYFEDVDICYRAREAGYKIGWCCKNIIHHLGNSTLIKSQKDFNYNDALKRSHKIFYQKMKDKKSGKSYDEKKIFKINEHKICTFVIGLKNRSKRATRLINMLCSLDDFYFFDLIVVEDKGSDMVNMRDIKDDSKIKHFVVNTGDFWNRSKVLNFGAKKARTKFIAFLDADFWFDNEFLSMFKKKLCELSDCHVVDIPSYESGKSMAGGTNLNKGDRYGSMWVYSNSIIRDITGFDERFVGWGREEKDMLNRAKMLDRTIVVKGDDLSDVLKITHLSHGNENRNINSKTLEANDIIKKDNLDNMKIRANDVWGLIPEDIKRVTFCMCLKSRSERAYNSIKTLVTAESIRYFNFIIVEDYSDDLLDLSDFKYAGYVTHYVVDTGVGWTRSGLLNYGIKKFYNTDLICFWDADFIAPNAFTKNYLDLINTTDFDKYYLRVKVTETNDTVSKGVRVPSGQLWGGFYTYKTSQLIKVGGFDEQFRNWGYEDIDLNSRLEKAYAIKKRSIGRRRFLFHFSHDDKIRNYPKKGFKSNKRIYESNLSKNIIVANKNKKWGEFDLFVPNKIRKDEVIIVMGNGPSLKEIDFNSISGYNTFGMNLAYRYWEKIGWWPTYYGCFDNLVIDDHKEELIALIENNKIPIRKYFLLKKVSNSPKLRTVKLTTSKVGDFSMKFSTFGYGGNTGANCCQVSACLGFKKIIIVGVDCNYVEVVKEAEIFHHGGTDRLKMAKTPDGNPNYFFADYNRKGDKYNIPRTDVFMEPAWNSFSKFAIKNNIEVINCSEASKLTCFRKSSLIKELPR